MEVVCFGGERCVYLFKELDVLEVMGLGFSPDPSSLLSSIKDGLMPSDLSGRNTEVVAI